MRLRLRLLWVAALLVILGLGSALVVLQLRIDRSLLDVVAALAGTAASVVTFLFTVNVTRDRRDRMRRRQVFISYALGDEDAARRLEWVVRRDGYAPVLGGFGSARGSAEQLQSLLKQSGAVLIVQPSGRREHTRGWEHIEQEVIRQARGLRRDVSPVVPVITGGRSGRADAPLENELALDLRDPGWEGSLRLYLDRAFDTGRREEPRVAA